MPQKAEERGVLATAAGECMAVGLDVYMYDAVEAGKQRRRERAEK